MNVPLVLPMSWMNESSPTVKMLACSPLMARLSIMISHPGLRPIFMSPCFRSMWSMTSLLNLMMILAILFPRSRYRRQKITVIYILNLSPQFLQSFLVAREVAIGAHQNHRDVVRPAALVGDVHHAARGGVEIAPILDEHHFDVTVGQDVVQTVRAEQIDVIVVQRLLADVGGHGGIHAQGARHEVLVHRHSRFLGGHQTAADQFLHD